MKSIILLNTGIATQNIGDEIINDSIKRNWSGLYRCNYIYNMPSHTPPYSWWQQLLFKKKLSAFKNADIKFLCGTNALYTNMLRPVPQWNIHLWNHRMFDNTVLLGVGAGINSSSINYYTRNLYSKVLNHDLVHSVRDDNTVDFLNKMGFNAINTGCPTLWGFVDGFCRDIPSTKSDSVVFTLTGYQPDRENDKLMIEILERNYSNLYFWPQTFADFDYFKSLGDFRSSVVAPNLVAYDEILNQNVDYVGNRLHGGIRALQHKKRALIIAIDYRARNMRDKNSLPVIDREEIISHLDNWINSDTKINITGIDKSVIAKWQSQFGLD